MSVSEFAANLKRLLDLRYPRASLRRRAAALGLSPAYLSEILHGRPVPAETARRIAEALGVSPEALAGRSELAPADPFDFSFRSALAWRWCLSVIRQRLPDPAWRQRFADAVVLFFFTAEGFTDFPTPDDAREALGRTRRKILACRDFEDFYGVLRELFSHCSALPDNEDEGTEEPEGEFARRARTLVFHALLFAEDLFSYLASPSPLRFVPDEQRLAWVNRTALAKVLEFARSKGESGREP